MRRVRVTISGEVQGVGYRYTMQRVAERAGTVGWVRNLRDGRVEAEIEGTDAAVRDVLTWAAEGPRGGYVDDLSVQDLPPIGGDGFEVRRDG
ncbi:acylphosphatase [Microbacterium dextranolyticum]|uniref:acylphosphatase n=1 Tax=Microbacterium dextranolyticum TaxID=36806 RepID=A0A9W6HKN5_9MICO|nr:acylphosphatase [Microbacterium dextranolyticum]MBM7462229.1 acylphosphatase [Microbacterium dextranolyticum]GLJ94481.1 acylphosphatase [Microbacterium dextranolyticum]